MIHVFRKHRNHTTLKIRANGAAIIIMGKGIPRNGAAAEALKALARKLLAENPERTLYGSLRSARSEPERWRISMYTHSKSMHRTFLYEAGEWVEKT